MGKQMYFMPRDNSEEDAPKKPKYGGAEECPGCHQPVYPMERVRGGVAESSQFLSEFVFANKFLKLDILRPGEFLTSFQMMITHDLHKNFRFSLRIEGLSITGASHVRWAQAPWLFGVNL